MLRDPHGALLADLQAGINEFFFSSTGKIENNQRYSRRISYKDTSHGESTKNEAVLSLCYQNQMLVMSPLESKEEFNVLWTPSEMLTSTIISIPLGVSIELRNRDRVQVLPRDFVLFPHPNIPRAYLLTDEQSRQGIQYLTFYVRIPQRYDGESPKVNRDEKELFFEDRVRENERHLSEGPIDASPLPMKVSMSRTGIDMEVNPLERLTPPRETIRPDTFESRPFCKYGKHCYQQNQHHHNSFRHDFENQPLLNPPLIIHEPSS